MFERVVALAAHAAFLPHCGPVDVAFKGEEVFDQVLVDKNVYRIAFGCLHFLRKARRPQRTATGHAGARRGTFSHLRRE